MRSKRQRGLKTLIEKQRGLHEKTKRVRMDASQAMVLFAFMIRQTARWDAMRGIDPVERWRRLKSLEI